MVAPNFTSPPLLTVLQHRPESTPGLTGLCAGFESGEWRFEALAEALLEWLPEFCLRQGELTDLTPRTIARRMKRAARLVYETRKFENRGEFGELLLHVVLAEVFHTLPAISKIYYKDGPNETVKGFDAVHVVPVAGPDGAPDSALELWLGEVKFYDDAARAIRDVVAELQKHADRNYLRREFAAVRNKIDDSWPHATALRRLLDENTSLDTVFSALCVPVLLTYDSTTLGAHTAHGGRYVAEIRAEWERHYNAFVKKGLPEHLKVHLFLVPLATKARLIAALDDRLRVWQQL